MADDTLLNDLMIDIDRLRNGTFWDTWPLSRTVLEHIQTTVVTNIFVAGVPHRTLTELDYDDHVQYLTEARHDTTTRHTLGSVVPHDDHGALSGLADDDHTQYLLQNGSRKVTGNLLPNATDQYDLGSSTLLWRKGYLAELDAVVFAQQTVTLVGGWLIVGKNEGVFPANVVVADTQINFGSAMTVGDYVLMRAAGKVEYVSVGSLVGGTTYNVTRNLDGSGANDWPAGTPFAVIGQAGNGWLELNAYDTPRLSIFKHNGTTYNNKTEVVRLGDLVNWDGNAAEHYGIGIGDYAGGNYLKYDPAGGFTLKGGNGSVNIDASGVQVSFPDNYLAEAAIRFKRTSTGEERARLYTTGNLGQLTYLENSQTPVKSGLPLGEYYSAIALHREVDSASISMNAGPYGTENRFEINRWADTGYALLYAKDSFELRSNKNRIQQNARVFDMAQRTMGLEAFDLDGVRNGAWICKWTYVGANPVLVDEWGGGHHLTYAGANTGYMVGVRERILLQQLTAASSQYHYYGTVGELTGSDWFAYGGWFKIDDVTTYRGLIGAGTTTFAHGLYVHTDGTLRFKKYSTTNVAWEWNIGYIGTGWHFVWFQFARYFTTVWNWVLWGCIDGTFYTITSGQGGNDPGDIRTPVGQFTVGRMETAYLEGAAGVIAVTGWIDSCSKTVADFYNLSKPNFVV